MKTPTITELAKLIGKDRSTVQRWKEDRGIMFFFLWKGYTQYLFEKESNKDIPQKLKA